MGLDIALPELIEVSVMEGKINVLAGACFR